jgi:hypothetical protein
MGREFPRMLFQANQRPLSTATFYRADRRSVASVVTLFFNANDSEWAANFRECSSKRTNVR